METNLEGLCVLIYRNNLLRLFYGWVNLNNYYQYSLGRHANIGDIYNVFTSDGPSNLHLASTS